MEEDSLWGKIVVLDVFTTAVKWVEFCIFLLIQLNFWEDLNGIAPSPQYGKKLYLPMTECVFLNLLYHLFSWNTTEGIILRMICEHLLSAHGT